MSISKFFIFEFFKMTEENQKNRVATVGMRFSIIGLIILILNIIWIATTFNETPTLLWVIILIITLLLRIWIPLLFIWFILWIIWLFYKPKAKARIAILIPIFSIIFINISTYEPTNEFINWAQETNQESIDKDVFKTEFKKVISDKTQEDLISMYNSHDSINPIKKASYLFFSLVKEAMNISLEEINNWDTTEIINEEDEVITIDIEKNEKNESEESDNNSDTQTEKVEIFTKEEQNDIEQVLKILE